MVRVVYGMRYTAHESYRFDRVNTRCVVVVVVVTADAGRERRHRHDPPADGHQETAGVPRVHAVPVQEHDVPGTGQERRPSDQRAQTPARRH